MCGFDRFANRGFAPPHKFPSHSALAPVIDAMPLVNLLAGSEDSRSGGRATEVKSETVIFNHLDLLGRGALCFEGIGRIAAWRQYQLRTQDWCSFL